VGFVIVPETIFVNDPDLYGGFPSFGTPVAAGQGLIDAGFDVVTQASNHSWDRRDTGIFDTLDFWDAHPEITHLGLNRTEEDYARIRSITKNGITVAFLTYTYTYSRRTSVLLPWVLPEMTDPEVLRADIARAKEESDVLVVFAHWGEEYVAPTAIQRQWAQFFADEGVDVVIGSHPHVLQPLEYITGASGNEMPCYFSLGNFLSAQRGASQILGGMADIVFEKDENGCRITKAELAPTLTWTYWDEATDRLQYRALLLEDYTREMSARHTQSYSPDALWSVFEPFQN